MTNLHMRNILILVYLGMIKYAYTQGDGNSTAKPETHNLDCNDRNYVWLPRKFITVVIIVFITSALLQTVLIIQTLVNLYQACREPTDDDDDFTNNRFSVFGLGSIRRKSKHHSDPDDDVKLRRRGNNRSVHFKEENESISYRLASLSNTSVHKEGLHVLDNSGDKNGKGRRFSVPAPHMLVQNDLGMSSSPRQRNKLYNSDSHLHVHLPTITVLTPENENGSIQEIDFSCIPSKNRLSPLALYNTKTLYEDKSEYMADQNQKVGVEKQNYLNDQVMGAASSTKVCVSQPHPSSNNMGLDLKIEEMFNFDVPHYTAPHPPLNDDDDEFLEPNCSTPYSQNQEKGQSLHHRNSIDVSVPEETAIRRGVFDFVNLCEPEDHTLEMWEIPKRFHETKGALMKTNSGNLKDSPLHPPWRYSSYEMREASSPRPKFERRRSVQLGDWKRTCPVTAV